MSNKDSNQGRDQNDFPRVPDDDLYKIIKGGDVESAQLTVYWGEKVGNATNQDDGQKVKVTSSQLRAIFTSVRLIEAQWPSNTERDEQKQQKQEEALRKFILLKSKLVYQAKRHEKTKLTHIKELFIRCIDLVNDPKNKRKEFLRFVDFFEAILAYHKSEGKVQ